MSRRYLRIIQQDVTDCVICISNKMKYLDKEESCKNSSKEIILITDTCNATNKICVKISFINSLIQHTKSLPVLLTSIPSVLEVLPAIITNLKQIFNVVDCAMACANGGQCVDGKCVCAIGFTGPYCSTSKAQFM